MSKLKRNISLVFSSIAILVLILHGIIPHHHHHADESYCSLDAHSSDCNSEHSHENTIDFNEASCCESEHQGHSQSGVCSINIEASKHVSINFIAVFTSSSNIGFVFTKAISFYKYLRIFVKTLFYDSFSLRGPPVS